MEESKQNEKTSQPKMATISDIQREYLPGSYKKIKAFCLTYLNYKKIGRTYYFNRSEIEKLISTNKPMVYNLDEY